MSDDLIKREDAIEALKGREGILHDAYTAVAIIRSVPSADRPQGEWKPKNHHTDYCSECGFEETQWRTTEYRFCPLCGAQMKGADNE